MFKRAINCLLVAASFPFSICFANQGFNVADAEFSARAGKNFQQLTQIRELYKNIFTQGGLTTEESLKAITQMGRLDIYRGGLLAEVRNDVTIEQQKQAMDECIRDIELIADTNSAPYHFIKITCIGYRGKLETTVMGRMKYGLQMRKAQGPALEVADAVEGNFEGGGIYRVLSALRGNRKAKPLGLYDANESLSYAQKALNVPNFEDYYFETNFNGKDYFENYYYQAQGYVAVGIETEDLNSVIDGLSILKSKIRKISFLEKNNKLGERAAETLAYKVVMNKLKVNVEQCEQEADWKSCLINKLAN